MGNDPSVRHNRLRPSVLAVVASPASSIYPRHRASNSRPGIRCDHGSAAFQQNRVHLYIYLSLAARMDYVALLLPLSGAPNIPSHGPAPLASDSDIFRVVIRALPTFQAFNTLFQITKTAAGLTRRTFCTMDSHRADYEYVKERCLSVRETNIYSHKMYKDED